MKRSADNDKRNVIVPVAATLIFENLGLIPKNFLIIKDSNRQDRTLQIEAADEKCPKRKRRRAGRKANVKGK